MSATPTSRAGWLGVDVSVITVEELLDVVDGAAAGPAPVVIAGHNLHSAYLVRTEPEFADFYDRSDVVVIDGRPVLAALNRERRARGLGALPAHHRFGSTDWIGRAAALPGVGRVCAVGGEAESNRAFAQRLRAESGDLEVLAIPGHPWSEEREREVIAQVGEFRPDLVLVGMGMPLQERVVLAMVAQIDRGVFAAVGGAIDQLSGAQALAPRWTGRLGVEWLWRLASDPRRLANRYLVEPVKLARLISKEHQQR